MTEVVVTDQNNTFVTNTVPVQTVVTQTPRIQTIVTGMMAPTSAVNVDQLRDVDISQLGEGSILVYNAQTQKWTATTLLDQQIIESGQF